MSDYNPNILINYEVLEVMHTSSAWGNVVFKVAHKDKLYILKCYPNIDSGLQKTLFYREMEALKELNSCEGIVKLRHTETELYPFSNLKKPYGGILMDFVPGKTLDSIVWSDVPELSRLEICKKIAIAINNAHSHSVIHRDIKPSNIIYDDIAGNVTVIDFGTSKIKSIVNDTDTTMPMYSQWYSAPELVQGKGVTEKADYYSMGIVFYEILLGKKPSVYHDMLRSLESWTSVRREIRDLIINLIEQNPENRPNSLSETIELLEKITAELNTSSNEFCILVSQDDLRKLKNRMIIEHSMTMQQFTSSYLRKQFKKAYGYVDSRDGSYVITGTEIVMQCHYDESSNKITASKISEIAPDRRNINLKRSFEVPGLIRFSVNYSNASDTKDNHKLSVLFRNSESDYQQYRIQEESFDQLFSKWEQGLQESVETERGKAAFLEYAPNFEFVNDQLILEITDIENKTVDEIPEQAAFVVEAREGKSKIFTEIGTFEDITVDDDRLKMVFNRPSKGFKPSIKSLLRQKAPVCEDYYSKTIGYQRQLKAIKSLRNDDYSSRGLKDIILCLDEPEEIPTIKQPSFISDKLNDSQRSAVQKALNTESICLIQGPPGTGKTSVIKEIVGQIIKHDVRTSESPRILIVSQSHTAVDNILEGLSHIIDDQTEVLRIGADNKISQEICERYTLSAHQRNLAKEITENVKSYSESKDIIIDSLDDPYEKEQWSTIKAIQQDWIERLSDLSSVEYQLIKSAVVVAGTCIGFLSNPVVRDMLFNYVIIDEAAKATTPELLVSIIKADKIILVGDQNQLPAYADRTVSPTIAELSKAPEYRLFDILYKSLPESHKQILTTQYRMIENIGNLISQVFYGGKINTGCNDEEKLHGLSEFEGKSIVWLDTSNNPNKMQRKTKGSSYYNEEEKRIIMELLQKLENNGELNNQDIGIITGYNGQKELLRKSVRANGYDRIASIDINTLDAFQGRENDIIIYSTVRTKDSIGFQKEKERVNVAFSRAKKLLIICGDLDFFYAYDDPDNKFVEIIDYIREHDQCSIVDCKGGRLF